MSKRPILVTGSIRAGTTWLGRMISASSSVGYIHEPLNPWDREKSLGVCNVRIPYWFLYITEVNQLAYRGPLEDTLGFHYSLVGAAKGITSLGDVKRIWREMDAFRSYRRQDARPLVKDPFALFSAEWFADTFDADIVVLIRHPAAIASSLKRLDWGLPFWHLLEQTALIRDHLHPFRAELEAIETGQHDIIDQAILLWNVLYYTVGKYRGEHDDWIFLRHEDVARDPMQGFHDLYAALSLQFTQEVESVIREHCGSSNPAEVPADWPYALRRHSSETVWRWKDRLTPQEIARVKEGTFRIAQQFYSDEDW